MGRADFCSRSQVEGNLRQVLWFNKKETNKPPQLGLSPRGLNFAIRYIRISIYRHFTSCFFSRILRFASDTQFLSCGYGHCYSMLLQPVLVFLRLCLMPSAFLLHIIPCTCSIEITSLPGCSIHCSVTTSITFLIPQ